MNASGWPMSQFSHGAGTQETQLHGIPTEVAVLAKHIESIAEMTSMFETTSSDTDVQFLLSRFASQVFPQGSGVIYAVQNKGATLVPVSQWGNRPQAQSIVRSDCMGTTLAQRHISEETAPSTTCMHVRGLIGSHVCMPIIYHNDLMGLMTIQCSGIATEDVQSLSSCMASSAALAMSNVKTKRQVTRMSVRDSLTGLFNRQYAAEFLAQELVRSSRKGTQLAVSVIAVDRFSAFTQSFGVDAGNSLLRSIAKILQNHVRGSDVCARIQGAEFAVVMPEVSSAVAANRAEQMRAAVSVASIKHKDSPLPQMSISVGVAEYPAHGLSGAAIVANAQQACRQAGETRNRVICVK